MLATLYLFDLFFHAGSSRWVLQPGEDCELKEGASALIRDHYRRGEGLSQPSPCLHHQRAASWLSSQRWHHQKRYKGASGDLWFLPLASYTQLQKLTFFRVCFGFVFCFFNWSNLSFKIKMCFTSHLKARKVRCTLRMLSSDWNHR